MKKNHAAINTVCTAVPGIDGNGVSGFKCDLFIGESRLCYVRHFINAGTNKQFPCFVQDVLRGSSRYRPIVIKITARQIPIKRSLGMREVLVFCLIASGGQK